MKRLERLTAILTYLQSRKKIGIGDLEQRFPVTRRTLFRDIKSLRESGVPIAFEEDRGYHIVEGYYLPPLSFSLEEAKSFIFVEQLARKYIDAETLAQFDSAMDKIRAKLKGHQLVDLEKLGGSVSSYINPNFEVKNLSKAEQACSQKQVLEIRYRNFSGEITHRVIEPIGITFYSQQWHLIAFCQLRQDYRDFVLSRMEVIRITGEQFSQEHLSLDQYIEQLA